MDAFDATANQDDDHESLVLERLMVWKLGNQSLYWKLSTLKSGQPMIQDTGSRDKELCADEACDTGHK